jgi:prolyl oligopeptidase
MKKLFYFVLVPGIFILAGCAQKQPKLEYPMTKKGDVVDEYFGSKVPDPYRWLENDTSQETEAWVVAQNEVTFGYLTKIPFRDSIKQRITNLWNYPKYGVPFKKADYYFFTKNDGLQNQSVLYVQTGMKGEPRILLDPNTLSPDGTIALANYAVSKDARYLGYSIAEAGSDWNKIYVMDILNGEKLPDELLWVKFSGVSWKDDGFYYSRYDEPAPGTELSAQNRNHKVYYHKVGTPQGADVLVYENPAYPLRNYYAGTTEDEKYLILYETESTYGNSLFFKDLSKPEAPFIMIAEGFDYEYGLVDNIGNSFLIQTTDGAQKRRLVMVNADHPAKKSWKEIVPEKEEVLEGATLLGGKIFTQYMKDAASKVLIFDYSGQPQGEVALPGIGSLGGFSGSKDDNIAFYLYTSFTYPNTIFMYDVANNNSLVYKESDIDFNPDEYVVKQEFYESKDGTRVPMFIVHHKDLQMNGKNPVLLYGYGGFNASMTPYFSISRIVYLENGFVWAMPNIRGGGEYGEEWHKGGTLLKKQNVFDDFIAAAEYLVKQGYTNPDKIAIAGGSNGGLLIGACMAQQPDLFKVALPAVGVLDMLRYHKFTIGYAWASDYGTSEDDSTMFNYLYGYSPLHNIKKGISYPATLITTGDHDDRVVPAHSFKFAATLQEANKGNNPVLIRIETRAGHGGGKPTAKIIEEVSDVAAFTFYNLGVNP